LKYKVSKIVKESELVSSIYLKRADGKTLEQFLPGQHLLFGLHLPSNEKIVHRFYSFSDSPEKTYYRISVKKEMPPILNKNLHSGVASTYLTEKLKVGEILEARGPLGNFVCEIKGKEELVLIAGGIGITPLLSIIKALQLQNRDRKVWLFFGVTNSKDHIFKKELEQLKLNTNFQISTFYTNPLKSDRIEKEYDFIGNVDFEVIRRMIQLGEQKFYICGPRKMMNYHINALKVQGISLDKIYTESFSSKSNPIDTVEQSSIETKKILVTFSKSGRIIEWNHSFKNLWELANSNGIEIEVGCLFGDCGTCMTPISAGVVSYNHKTTAVPDEGTCLPCSCKPLTSLEIDS